jgi:hypothetical protein
MKLSCRDYDRNDYHGNHHNNKKSRHYESEDSEESSGKNAEPNNKVIVRGLPPQITEADVR